MAEVNAKTAGLGQIIDVCEMGIYGVHQGRREQDNAFNPMSIPAVMCAQNTKLMLLEINRVLHQKTEQVVLFHICCLA